MEFTAGFRLDGGGTFIAPPPPPPLVYLWAWGRNGSGRLGLGNTTDYSSPKQIGALTTWLSITAGYFNSAAIKTDGTIWSWGSATGGATGLGFSNLSSPNQVGALTNWLNVSAGSYYSLAIG